MVTDTLVPNTVPPIVRLLRPFQQFVENKAAGGVLLLACTVVALFLANSPWHEHWSRIWQTTVTAGAGPLLIAKPLLLWVNDGLMAVFFFVVGLEIKREVLVGELASVRQAALPIAAAAGGVIVPASIYALINAGGPGSAGWGIPMATDIAFALGILALLGDRVPMALTVFLTALAIVDDIAAVLVIAFFYTAEIFTTPLMIAAGMVAVLFLCNRLGVRHPIVYALVGLVLWVAVLKSGIHATIAGVTLAFFIPSRTLIDPDKFVTGARSIIDHFESVSRPGSAILDNQDQQAALHALETASEAVQPPLHRMEHNLHSWVAFFIMPVFALANAGVSFGGDDAISLMHPVTLGVLLGLVVGKPIGILCAAWLAVKAGIADLPAGVSWKQVHGAGWLGGIGFTMSLFVAGLAFGESPLLATAKVGILGASALAAITGSLIVRKSLSQTVPVAVKPEML